MKKNTEYGEGTLFTIMNYFMWIFVGNLLFITCTFPMMFILFFLGDQLAELGIITPIIALLVGPALTALLCYMGKVVRDQDVAMFKDFFKGYKDSFKQTFLFWTAEVLLISVLIFNMKLIQDTSFSKIYNVVVISIILIIFMLSLYIYPIISRFYLKPKDILKLSVYYAAKKIHITILNMVAVFLGLFMCYQIPSIFPFFFFAVIAYIVMYTEAPILKEIEEKISKANKEKQVDKIEENN
ncbi:MAG: YesL family protein [Clostridiaceae bacterium]